MKKGSAITMMTTFFLVGCASMTWNKPDVTQAEFNKDSYECQRDARQSGYYGSGIAGAINMREFLQMCMVSKGYTQE